MNTKLVATLLKELKKMPIIDPHTHVRQSQPVAAHLGDLLGYHWLDRTRLALYVLDVCGHGVGPAMHSASVLNVLRNQTLPRADFGAPLACAAGARARSWSA